MTGDCRFLLAAVFLALAERSPSNVKVKNREPRRTQRLKNRIAEEANQFVVSENFDELCDVLDLNPENMRRIEPDKANVGYIRLVSNHLKEDI